MTADPPRASTAWLFLREPADAAARSVELVDELTGFLPATASLQVHDLGAGAGSMVRWLAPRLAGTQHWVLHDRDTDLLAATRLHSLPRARDGAPVTIDTRAGDLTRRAADELADADLVTASALLDMLTGEELERLLTLCAAPGCPVLVTLSVVGHVELDPEEPLDSRVMAAFNAHQRRTIAAGRLLGPEAVTAAVDGFRRRGREVAVRPSPWRLGRGSSRLAAAWLDGWCAAAVDQRPDLAEDVAAYRRRRSAQLAAGRLAVTVHHQDLLVRPAAGDPDTAGIREG